MKYRAMRHDLLLVCAKRAVAVEILHPPCALRFEVGRQGEVTRFKRSKFSGHTHDSTLIFGRSSIVMSKRLERRSLTIPSSGMYMSSGSKRGSTPCRVLFLNRLGERRRGLKTKPPEDNGKCGTRTHQEHAEQQRTEPAARPGASCQSALRRDRGTLGRFI
jgi:hypothetical protein